MIYRLESHQIIRISPEKTWEFLSKPENLAKSHPSPNLNIICLNVAGFYNGKFMF